MQKYLRVGRQLGALKSEWADDDRRREGEGKEGEGAIVKQIFSLGAESEERREVKRGLARARKASSRIAIIAVAHKSNTLCRLP